MSSGIGAAAKAALEGMSKGITEGMMKTAGSVPTVDDGKATSELKGREPSATPEVRVVVGETRNGKRQMLVRQRDLEHLRVLERGLAEMEADREATVYHLISGESMSVRRGYFEVMERTVPPSLFQDRAALLEAVREALSD